MSSLPRRLPKQGPVKARWAAHHAKSRAEVMRRSQGFCEVGCGCPAEEWAHLYGRRHIVGEPHCSSPELTVALCKEHHRAIDRNLRPDLQTALRWRAVGKFAQRYNIGVPVEASADPVGTMRWLVDEVDSIRRSDAPVVGVDEQ